MTNKNKTASAEPNPTAPRGGLGIRLCMAALITSAAPVARAAPSRAPCSAVRVVQSGDLGPGWREAVAALRAEVASLGPSECAEVTFVVQGDKDGVLLTASTLDGRRGQRAVTRPSSLVFVALGLMASIPPEESVEPPPAAESPSAAELPPPDAPAPPARTAAPPAPTVRLEAALAAGARFGFPTRVGMAELEARADVVAGSWLVVASARFAPFGASLGRTIPGYAYDEIVLGLGFGRRWVAGAAALDVTVSPELAVMTEEGDLPADGAGGTESEARVAAAVRLHLPLGDGWKPSVTVDAELAPLAHALRVEAALPPLPTWTLGVRAGAVGDLL